MAGAVGSTTPPIAAALLYLVVPFTVIGLYEILVDHVVTENAKPNVRPLLRLSKGPTSWLPRELGEDHVVAFVHFLVTVLLEGPALVAIAARCMKRAWFQYYFPSGTDRVSDTACGGSRTKSRERESAPSLAVRGAAPPRGVEPPLHVATLAAYLLAAGVAFMIWGPAVLRSATVAYLAISQAHMVMSSVSAARCLTLRTAFLLTAALAAASLVFYEGITGYLTLASPQSAAPFPALGAPSWVPLAGTHGWAPTFAVLALAALISHVRDAGGGAAGFVHLLSPERGGFQALAAVVFGAATCAPPRPSVLLAASVAVSVWAPPVVAGYEWAGTGAAGSGARPLTPVEWCAGFAVGFAVALARVSYALSWGFGHNAVPAWGAMLSFAATAWAFHAEGVHFSPTPAISTLWTRKASGMGNFSAPPRSAKDI